MRVLFTGLGSIGRRHLEILREREEQFDVDAYRSGETQVEAPPGVTEYGSLEEALSVDPEVAFITNPTALHVETAIQCAERGCDLFIEKPLSDSLSGVDELEETVRRHGLTTYVGCNLRFTPVLQTVKEVLEDDRVGDILSFRVHAGSYLPDWRPDQDYRESCSASAELGGGVVLDLIHEFDYVYWLFGDITEVAGFTDQIGSLEIATEDVSEVSLRTAAGAVGSVHLDYFRRIPRRTVEVTGEEGVVSADFNAKEVTVETPDDTDVYGFEYERDDVYRDQLKYFLSHVRDGSPCHNDIAEAKKVLEIALEVKHDG